MGRIINGHVVRILITRSFFSKRFFVQILPRRIFEKRRVLRINV